eukprot:965790-Alexandrium_andersonii.AAC.1
MPSRGQGPERSERSIDPGAACARAEPQLRRRAGLRHGLAGAGARQRAGLQGPREVEHQAAAHRPRVSERRPPRERP